MTEIRELQPTSFAEFDAMPKREGWNYELIDGIVKTSPQPSALHQQVSENIYHKLHSILKEQQHKPLLAAELILQDNYFIPDIMICQNELNGTRCEKLPLLIVEVINPFTMSRAFITKHCKYKQFGIHEYWIVSPVEKCIAAFDFAAGTENLYYEGQIISTALPEITIKLKNIFA